MSADLTEKGTPLGNLMHDLRCADPDEMHYTELRDKVTYYKRTEKGVAEMSAVFEAIVEQERANSFKKGRSEGLEIGLKEGEARGEARSVNNIVNNMLKKNFSIDDIAAATNLSVDEVNNLRKSMHL